MLWIDHSCGPYIRGFLRLQGIPYKECIPDEVEEFTDHVIVSIDLNNKRVETVQGDFRFLDYKKWEKLGKEVNFIFVNEDRNYVYPEVILNGPMGDYIIERTVGWKNFFEKVKRLEQERVEEGMTTFGKLYGLRQMLSNPITGLKSGK